MKPTWPLLFLLSIACAQGPSGLRSDPSDMVVPNDNRVPAGDLQDGVLTLDLVARVARWAGEPSDLDPEADEPEMVTVFAFAEGEAPPSIPAPLIRIPQGTEVRVRVTNSLEDSVSIGLPGPGLRYEGMTSAPDPVLIVHGLRAGTTPDDTTLVALGETREVRYTADVAGTFLYWATPSDRPITSWTGRDAQLAGAIVVDPSGTTPDPEERIFVVTMLDQLPDSASTLAEADLFRRAINGRSWPDTERFDYAAMDTVRWRWINASFDSHPMHLHGFHFDVLAKGDGVSDTTYSEDRRRLAVTEHMLPGSTFRMEWVPTRAGHWVFHCHILDHIVPTIERDEAMIHGDVHDVERHPIEAMGGLVLGITVRDTSAVTDEPPHDQIRLLAQERTSDDGLTRRGFVVERMAPPAPDSVPTLSPPLFLTRDRTTEITVINRLSEPTTIHWHGLELDSYYDGVAGWSRTDSRVAPLIAPGDSFAVRIKPPRAGTYIYHTHMDETDQLIQGMVGPFLVLEPDVSYDPDRDRVVLIGGAAEGEYPITVNGSTSPAAEAFERGRTYRLRFLHMSQGVTVNVTLSGADGLERWRPVAKDGADLPPSLQSERPAEFETNTGETFDFEWAPQTPGDLTLSVTFPRFFEGGTATRTQTFRVR